jgi:serine/threonine protein phosphatase PrpC
VLITDKEIYCANVGDSRAVVIGFVNGKYEATPLSIDQKPSYGPERDRILKAGGRIDNQRDERGRPIGPLRVWLSKIRIPGLAMTRSFGDKAGTQAGMIANPVVLKHTLRQ